MACRNHSKNIPKFSVAEKEVLENAERQISQKIGMENHPNELIVLHEIPSDDSFADELYQQMVYEGCFIKYDSQDWRPEDNEKDQKEELDFYSKGKVLWLVGIIQKTYLNFQWLKIWRTQKDKFPKKMGWKMTQMN